MKAIIYTRVSTEEQAETGTSLGGQMEACQRVAVQIGAQIVGHYTDAGVSGADYATRQGLQKALADLETGKADALIVYDVTRLSRDIEHLSAIVKRVRAAEARLLFHSGQFEDTPEGEMLLGVNGIFSQYERRKFRERSINGKIRRLQEGKQPNVGMRPYGYHIVSKADVLSGLHPAGSNGTYIVCDDEAQWVREIFTRYASGFSLRGIARWLQAGNVLPPSHAPDRILRYETPPRKMWHAATIQSILKNPVYKGKATYGKRRRIVNEARLLDGKKRKDYNVPQPEDKWLYVAGEVPALVDAAMWEACQDRLKQNKATRGGNPSTRYLFTGLLTCPICQRGLYGGRSRYKSQRYAAYRCRDFAKGANSAGIVCNKRHYGEGKLLSLLLEGVRQCPSLLQAAYETYLRSFHRDEDKTQRDQLEAELKTLERKERSAAEGEIEAISAGRDTAVYRNILAEVDLRRKEIQTVLAEWEARRQEKPQIVPKQMAEAIAEKLAQLVTVLEAEEDELSNAEKNALLAMVIEKIMPREEGLEMILRPQIPGATVTHIVTRLSKGKKKPLLRMAARTRSRLSFTAASGSPTIAIIGTPLLTSTSTVIR